MITDSQSVLEGTAAPDENILVSAKAVAIDADLTRRSKDALKEITFLPADSVRVKVDAGWVTLSGSVNWSSQRESAANAVRGLADVEGVRNQIGLKMRPLSGTVKTDIEQAIRRRLRNVSPPVQVSIQGSNVTLIGSVNTRAERELANDIVWGTPGVQQVTDNLTTLA